MSVFKKFGDYAIANEINNLANEDSRMGAIRMLKTFGKAAIPQLINVLGDPSRNAHAALILSDIGEAAIPTLLDALSDDSKKTFASAALNEMGKKENKTLSIIIPSLIEALADKSPQTRAIAGVTLLNFGELALEPYIPTLINKLGNADAGPFAANVLISIGKPAVGSLVKVASDEGKHELVNAILQEISKKDKTVQIPIETSQKAIPGPTLTPNQSPKFCKYCGASLTPNSVYCSQCGKKVE
jgi:HEAT repeat protein